MTTRNGRASVAALGSGSAVVGRTLSEISPFSLRLSEVGEAGADRPLAAPAGPYSRSRSLIRTAKTATTITGSFTVNRSFRGLDRWMRERGCSASRRARYLSPASRRPSGCSALRRARSTRGALHRAPRCGAVGASSVERFRGPASRGGAPAARSGNDSEAPEVQIPCNVD